MASFNVTGDDSSPLVTYSPANAWVDSTGGASLDSYFWSSFHQTSTKGAAATISFNGTGIWLYGSKNSTFGQYTISVDGGNPIASTASNSQQEFQALLGGTRGLKDGQHTVVLTNTGPGSLLDLDAFIIESSLGLVGSSISNFTVDDTDPGFKYGPAASLWQTPTDLGCFNRTQHLTSTAGATASYTFKGNAVSVYGSVAPGNGVMSVAVDGVSKTVDLGASASVEHPQVLLYYADGLGSQEHQLTFTNQGGKPVNVDVIQVYTASGLGGGGKVDAASASGSAHSSIAPHPTATPSAAAAAAKTAHKSSTGIIIGGVLAGALVFAIIAAVLFFVLRRRRPAIPIQPTTPTLPWQSESREKGGVVALQAPRLYMPPSPPAPMIMRTKSTTSSESRSSEYSSDGLLGERGRRGSPDAPPARAGAARKMSQQSSGPVRPPRPPTLKFPTGLRR